jgi:hypothetical protein
MHMTCVSMDACARDGLQSDADMTRDSEGGFAPGPTGEPLESSQAIQGVLESVRAQLWA